MVSYSNLKERGWLNSDEAKAFQSNAEVTSQHLAWINLYFAEMTLDNYLDMRDRGLRQLEELRKHLRVDEQ